MFYVSEKNWNKIIGYSQEAYNTMKSEIGGMSIMVEDEDGDWELIRPVILKQEVSSGNTHLDKDALAEYYTMACKKAGKRNFRFCWWHSHHTMAAFWSGTDLKAIDEFDKGDFSFALVVNLKEEYKFRISVWKPLEVHEDQTLEINRSSRVTKKMKSEVKDLCTKEVAQWKKNTYTPGRSYGHGYASSDQMGMFPATVATTDLSVKEETTFADLIEIVDMLMEEVIDGTMDYNEYVANTNETNKALKAEKSIYHVDHIEKSKVGDLLCMFPSDFIMYERNRTVKVSDCKISTNQYDWDYQDRMYNESFGGINNGSKL